jgi:hypothetical protein
MRTEPMGEVENRWLLPGNGVSSVGILQARQAHRLRAGTGKMPVLLSEAHSPVAVFSPAPECFLRIGNSYLTYRYFLIILHSS